VAIHARKPVDWLREDPNQPRKHFDSGELRRLGEDMLAHGQYRPVGARPDGTVIYGGRQLRAAKLVGMTELEVKIFDGPLSATDVGVMQWCENELRSSLSDPEKSDFCAGLLRLNPDWSQKTLAARLQVSEATVTHLLAVFKCVPAVQDAYRGGRLSRSDVYGMSKASEREQHELLAARLAGQLKNGQDVHRRARQSRNGNGQPAVRVGRIKCPLPSGAVVQVSGEGISLDDAIEAAQEWLKKARKASEMGWDCTTFERACRDEARA
jgi:ParB family transcriptional regulator, chromosome partitioning protein